MPQPETRVASLLGGGAATGWVPHAERGTGCSGSDGSSYNVDSASGAVIAAYCCCGLISVYAKG